MSSRCFRRFFYSFTKASVINMNDYTHNIQFHHWNELSSQKECGNLDFFSFFSSKVAIAALLLKSLLAILVFGFKSKLFRKTSDFQKLFRDVYPSLMRNIYPCIILLFCEMGEKQNIHF